MKDENLIKGSTNSILFSYKVKEQDEKKDEMINQIIFKKYEIKNKVGKTSTIDIYEGISKENNQPVIIKIENKSQEKLYLEAEAYNLHSFKGFGIPELIKLGKRKNNLILIEAKKGPSLYDLFLENNKKFSLNEICLIGIQCIERLKWIHSKNYIYRNIKPQNFVIGVEDPHVIYLQNFYLCQKYKSSQTNQHIKFRYTKEIIGTERYGSINALRGLSLGRKDDLESLCYMLIYFFLGKLPWQGIREENNILKHERIIKEKKNFKIDNYKVIPKDFCILFKYVKNLKFDQEPKYSLMIKLLQNIRNENQLFNNNNFFWIKNNYICLGSNIKSKKEGFRERLFSKIDKKTNTDNISDFEKKRIKNIDVNFENFGKGYIDDDDENEEVDNSYNEKTAYKVQIKPTFSENDNTNKEDNGEDFNENEKQESELNISNSSTNTKVYKLNGPLEAFVKKELIDDPDIDNIDELKNQEKNKKISIKKPEKENNMCNDIIKEEPYLEDEENIQNNKNEIIIEENNNINKYDKNKVKSFVSSNNNTIKQESTKESIQFYSKESDIKGNNNIGSLILIKNNSNENKIEDEKIKYNNTNENNNKKTKKKEKSIDSKISIKKKNIDKYGQIGPEIKNNSSKRSKSIINKSVKKNKNKDCIIF